MIIETKLTENDIDALYVRDQINHATWCNALRGVRGDYTDRALCELAIARCEQLHAVAARFNSDGAKMKAAKERDK